MNGKSRILAIMVAITGFIAASPGSAKDAPKDEMTMNTIPNCPTLTEAELKSLAKDGKVTLNDKEYSLISKKEAGRDYNGHLLEDKDALSSFLDKSKALVTVTRYINPHQSPVKKDHLKTHCPYNLEREKDIAVIALSPTAPAN